MPDGSEFHTVGAATLKLREANAVQTRGTDSRYQVRDDLFMYILHMCFMCAKDVAKAKQFLPFLQRAGKTEALVEFVASGSRLRLYIPKETCLITLLLSGIYCCVLFDDNDSKLTYLLTKVITALTVTVVCMRRAYTMMAINHDHDSHSYENVKN